MTEYRGKSVSDVVSKAVADQGDLQRKADGGERHSCFKLAIWKGQLENEISSLERDMANTMSDLQDQIDDAAAARRLAIVSTLSSAYVALKSGHPRSPWHGEPFQANA